MTAPRDVNAERVMHLRQALEDIRGSLMSYHGVLTEALRIAIAAIADDDDEQDAVDCDPEPS